MQKLTSSKIKYKSCTCSLPWALQKKVALTILFLVRKLVHNEHQAEIEVLKSEAYAPTV